MSNRQNDWSKYLYDDDVEEVSDSKKTYLNKRDQWVVNRFKKGKGVKKTNLRSGVVSAFGLNRARVRF